MGNPNASMVLCAVHIMSNMCANNKPKKVGKRGFICKTDDLSGSKADLKTDYGKTAAGFRLMPFHCFIFCISGVSRPEPRCPSSNAAAHLRFNVCKSADGRGIACEKLEF